MEAAAPATEPLTFEHSLERSSGHTVCLLSDMRPVSRARYLEELNRRLRMHRDYRPGMRVVSRRDGRGFDWEPNGYLHPFVEVSREVRKQFVIVEGRL